MIVREYQIRMGKERDYFLHGGNIRSASEKYKIERKKILDFSASINPIGLFPDVKKIINKNYKNLIHYPDPDYKDFKERLSQILHIPFQNILIGNGSIELIYLIINALKPENILIPIPSFTEYERSLKQSNAKISFLKSSEKNSFKIDPDKVINRLNKKDMLIIGNPNNPTGTILKKDDLMRILKESIKRNVLLIIDEVFMDFIDEDESSSMIYEAIKTQNLIIIRSLTKFYALPGLRIGYLIAHGKLIKDLKKCQYPWSVNSLALEVGKEVITNSKYIELSKKYLIKEKKYLTAELDSIKNIQLIDGRANFLFCKLINNSISSHKLFAILGRKGILIRDCSNFKGLNNKFFRIAVKKRAENKRLIAELKKVL